MNRLKCSLRRYQLFYFIIFFLSCFKAMTETVNTKGATRLRDPERNPCIKEADLTEGCLMRHNYKKESCQTYFDNYNKCKSFWSNVRRSRRMRGIKPEMPGEKEREEILAERRKALNSLVPNPTDEAGTA